MKNTITLPGHDVDGKLTPLVIAAMKAGATSAHDPKNPDNIVLTFHDAKARDEFAKALEAVRPSKITPPLA